MDQPGWNPLIDWKPRGISYQPSKVLSCLVTEVLRYSGSKMEEMRIMDKMVGQSFFDALSAGGTKALLAIVLLPIWIVDELCDLLLNAAGLDPLS